MIERKKNLELKKHVAAIHSGTKLTLLQRKIANALLFNAYDELFTKSEHEIHIPTLCKLIGYDSNDHKTIKKSLVNLLSTVIEWNLVDGDKIDTQGVWNASSMIADASIDGAVCTYSYSNKMKTLLHRPELYGRLNMLVQAKFQSSYGLALYENCIRYQNIEQTPWFDLLKFRKLMGVEGHKYKIFRDFKNRVLNKAIAEVNEYSPIWITAQFQKKGRQITAIQFSIQANKPDIIPEENQNTISNRLKMQFALSKKQITDICSQHDEAYILEKIAVVENSPSYFQGNIKNIAKYFLSAIKEDYQLTKAVKIKQKKAPQENHQDAYNRFCDKAILNKWDGLSLMDQQNILPLFEKHIQKGLYLQIYQREGLTNMLIQDQLCRFIKEKYAQFLIDIPTYQFFCENSAK